MAFITDKVQIQAVNKPKETKQYKNPSGFGKLSPLYQLRIRRCDKEGVLREDGDQVVAAVIDAEMHLEGQYSTPFENSNPENKLPTMIGMLQSGDWVETAATIMGGAFGVALSDDSKDSLNVLEGRSNLTKTNSTQIFVSSASVNIPMTLYFEAWEDAKVEVENQIKLLNQWVLPEHLEAGSLIGSVVVGQSLESLFPSIIPPYVALYYGGKKYVPMLINSVSAPMAVPMDDDGNRMALQVQVNFLSRTAWDAENINEIYR